ncbi:MAG: GtrA family protein [Pseudomonadota bacterium]
MKALLRQLLRFGVTGGIGFGVDGGLLLALISAGLDPYLARALSVPVAIGVTWYLNRIWTFADQRAGSEGGRQQGLRETPEAGQGAGWPALLREIGRYGAVQGLGALVNYAAYASVLLYLATPSFATPTTAETMLAFAIGSAVAMGINFLGARHVVFRP